MTRKLKLFILHDMLLRVNTFTDHELIVQTLFKEFCPSHNVLCMSCYFAA